MKKNLDDFREDDSGWRRFIPEEDMLKIDHAKVGLEADEDGQHSKLSKRGKKSNPNLP